MKINSNEFCSLSTSESFLGWLYQNAPELHKDLISHLRQGHGCSSNRKKMIAILSKIQKEKPLEESLADFIRSRYRQLILDDDVVNTQVTQTTNIHSVFSHYDPTLNSFPRKLIIIKRAESDLNRDVLNFCSQQGHCEYVIVEDRAYIEYLAHEHIPLKDKIPTRNWEVMAYKRANSLE